MLKTHVREDGIAVGGYDVTEYFNGAPKKGKTEFQSVHDGSAYHFASAENKAKFDTNPSSFLPQYNGWCATAASEGKYYYSNPEAFIIQNDKLFLFFDDNEGSDTRSDWRKDPDTRQENADRHWAADDLSEDSLQ